MIYIMFLVLSVAIIVLLIAEMGMQSYRQEIRYEDQVKVQRAWDGILAKIDADSQAGTLATVPATYTVAMNGVSGTVTVSNNSSTIAATNIAAATLAAADGRTFPMSGLVAKPATGLTGTFWQTNATNILLVSDADDYVLTKSSPTGSFLGLLLNYSGTDSTLIKTWLGSDNSSYVGTNGSFNDGIVKLFGTITTTSPNTSIKVLSNDGSVLNVDGDNYQINLDGTHASTSGTVNIPLAGTYPLQLTYFNHYTGIGTTSLQLQWKTDLSYVSIPTSALNFNPQVWTFNSSAATFGNGVQLVTGVNSQAGSAWLNTKQTITSFHAAFTFNIGGNKAADGFTFCIQNYGLNALGSNAGYLGYATSITPSAAIKFDIYSNSGEGTNSTGLYTNGAIPYSTSSQNIGSLSTNPDLNSGDTIHCTLAYSGTTLTETITDEDNGNTYTHSYTVNLGTVLGATTAYVGFTGGTSGANCTIPVIDFTFGP